MTFSAAEVLARLHFAKAEEYLHLDRLEEAHAAMRLALNAGIPPSDVFDRQRTIDAELAARRKGAIRRHSEELLTETPGTIPTAISARLEAECRLAVLEVTERLSVRWGKPVLVTVFADAESVTFVHARYGYYAERAESHKVCLPGEILASWGLARRALLHEIAHAASHSLSGQAPPRWLDEGVAVLCEGGTAPVEERQLRIAAARGRLPLMEEIDGQLGSYSVELDSLPAGICYAAAADFVGYLAESLGWSVLPRWLRSLRQYGDPRKALRACARTDLRKLERAWHAQRRP